MGRDGRPASPHSVFLESRLGIRPPATHGMRVILTSRMENGFGQGQAAEQQQRQPWNAGLPVPAPHFPTMLSAWPQQQARAGPVGRTQWGLETTRLGQSSSSTPQLCDLEQVTKPL